MSDYAISGDHGDQLMIDGLGPALGSTWRSKQTGEIVTVTNIRRGKRAFITIRRSGQLTDMPVEWLFESYDPCRLSPAP